MGFFDSFMRNNFDPDVKRYREEVKQRAREYREEAREFLQEAKELYNDDYKELRSEARSKANRVSDLIKSHNNYKAELLSELGGEISTTIENFKRVDIDNRIIKSINIDSGNNFSVPAISSKAFEVSSFITNMPGGNFQLSSLSFTSTSDLERDRDKAFDQYLKAQEYLSDVKYAIADLEYVIQCLGNTQKYIEDERQNLSQLMEKVRPLIQRLTSAMDKQSYTEQEAKFIKGICRIAEQIKNTLEEQITDKYGSIQSNYKKYGQRLKDINEAIPSAPVISSSSDSWLDNIVIIQY